MTDAGFSAEIHDLNYFQDDYGLKPINGHDNDDSDDDNDKSDEDGDDEKGASDDIDGSEGYEMVEGGEEELEDD